jgi:hypothetical protein
MDNAQKKIVNRLRVFESRLLSRLFGLRRDEVTDGRRKFHSEKYPNLYSSASIDELKVDKWTRNVARICENKKKEKKKDTFRLLVGKPEGKIPLGRPRRRWILKG